MARWRSGNAAVCKTVMRGFEPLPRLHDPEVVEHLVLSEIGDPMMTLTSLAGAWQLLQRCAGRALDETAAHRFGPPFS